MARLAGRSTWFTWFTGLCCLAIVGGLVLLAAPLAPAAVDWTVRTAGAFGEHAVRELTGAGDSAPEEGAGAAGELPTQCDALGEALGEVLGQDAAANAEAAGPPESADGLVALLAAQPVLECAWAAADGTAHAWLAQTNANVAAAEELLRAGGFVCERPGDTVRCTRSAAAEAEAAASTVTHLLRGGTWMIVSATGAGADDAIGALEETLWPR